MNVKHPPPWLFVLTGVPYGVVGSFTGVVMPYSTEHAGKQLDSIGWYGTLLFIPTVVTFLYAPLVDIGPRRKHWLLIMAALGAACLSASFLMPLPEHITAYLVFGFAAQLISGLVGSCNGGLMAASLPDELRGKASGWYNVGNLSGGGAFGSIAIAMIGHKVDPRLIAATAVAMMMIPALAVLWVEEPERQHRGSLVAVFHQTLRDASEVLFSRSGITGIAMCLSPVGTSALSNYFSGMSKPYHVDATTVALVTGLGNVGLTALGSFIGGYLCDRFNRRALYLTAGALTALCGLIMAISPRIELTYVVGVATYALITGFCYAAFTSTVLETIGKGGRSAATKYSMFVAAGNLAILYVGLIDTRFSARHGVEGVIGSDAALNIAGVIILAVVFWRLGSFGRWRHPAERPASSEEPVAEPEVAELPNAVARIAAKGDTAGG